MLLYFEGVAGTGKTTRLIDTLRDYVKKGSLNDGQKVLAITFMHGSRRRLQQTLSKEKLIADRFECLTIDSFAKRIAERWRSLIVETNFKPDPGLSHFQTTLLAANHATKYSSARDWISRSYPIIIVDEFQDCSEYHVQFISNIEPNVIILAAADEFQDLNFCGQNSAIKYLRSVGTGEELTKIHRTKRPGILDAAGLIRDGSPISTVCNKYGCGIHLRPAYSHIVATHGAARHLLWYGNKNVAILTPTKPDKVPIFKRVIEKLEAGPIKLNYPDTTVGPFKIKTVVSIESKINEEIKQINIMDEGNQNNCITHDAIKNKQDSEAIDILKRYLLKKRKLHGIVEVDIVEAIEHIRKTMLINYNLQTIKSGGIEALTVRQAKNREFETIIFLWPYSVPPSIEMRRRLLYNGITRAKNQVTILVEDPMKREETELFGSLKLSKSNIAQ